MSENQAPVYPYKTLKLYIGLSLYKLHIHIYHKCNKKKSKTYKKQDNSVKIYPYLH